MFVFLKIYCYIHSFILVLVFINCSFSSYKVLLFYELGSFDGKYYKILGLLHHTLYTLFSKILNFS